MRLKSFVLFVMVSAIGFRMCAAIIGTNVPAAPLTMERIAQLPATDQPAWRDYFEHSRRQMQIDRDFLAAELAALGTNAATTPPSGRNARGLSLENPSQWYGSPEARRIADMVVTYQTPAGGWSKNLDMVRHPRAPGEAFTVDNNNKLPVTGDYDQANDPNWHYVGTFDNDATITQVGFLARVIGAGETNVAAYRASFNRGLGYIFSAQYPNGGWPQVWPLEGGYHDAITLNDDAMLQIIKFLLEVSEGRGEYAFVPAETRARAAASIERGMRCLMAAQVVVDGHRTAWCQQYDPLTLAPTSARNYEMPALTSSESATVVLFMMELPHPGTNEVAAVHAAAAWFRKTEISNQEFRSAGTDGRRLVASPGSGPIWGRFYEIGSDRPIFGDRDKTIHDVVDEISRERRQGYAWYRDTPKRVLEHYTRWSKEHPL